MCECGGSRKRARVCVSIRVATHAESEINSADKAPIDHKWIQSKFQQIAPFDVIFLLNIFSLWRIFRFLLFRVFAFDFYPRPFFT